MFKLFVLVFAAIFAVAVAKPGASIAYTAPAAYGYAASPYYSGYGAYAAPYAYNNYGYGYSNGYLGYPSYYY